MATADIEEYLSERDWGYTLFSKQYCGQLIAKAVRIDSVVQKFIDSKIISVAEGKSLRDEKVADQKFRHLLNIVTDHCNRNVLQTLKTFIDILVDTNNIEIAQQLTQIYNERVKYVMICSILLKQKSSMANLENEISRLDRILKEKEGYIESLTDEKNKRDDHDRKVADDQNERLSLEKQIKKKNADLLFAEKEIGKLTRSKNDLENELKVKSNAIRKSEEELVEKERELWEATEESNRLRLKIDLLQQQLIEAMEEDKKMSKKIEKLEDEIGEKENAIMNLRTNKTITMEEIKETLENIKKGQGKNLDAQVAIIKKRIEKIDDQEAIIKQLNEKIDDQEAIIKQQNEKIDVLTRAFNLQLEEELGKITRDQAKKMDDLAAKVKQQNEKIDFLTDAVLRALSLQEKK